MRPIAGLACMTPQRTSGRDWKRPGSALIDRPAVGEVGLVLDPWQAEVLRSPSKRTLMLCSRQSGKSTTAAIMSITTRHLNRLFHEAADAAGIKKGVTLPLRHSFATSQATALANTPHSPQRVHSHQLAHTDCTPKSSLHPSLSQLATAARVPKSP